MDRFWAKVDQSNGCWLWKASLDRKGYGQFRLNGKMRRAHSISYELTVGEVPDGLVLDHLCRNPKCVRPDHLKPKTQRENVLCGTSFASINYAKTHCIHGHEFTKANTYIRPYGARDCRACILTRVKKYKKGKTA